MRLIALAILLAVAAALIVRGIAEFSGAAAYIVGGVLLALLAAGFLVERPPPPSGPRAAT